MILSSLGAYTWDAPYGYNADGSKIAPYGTDIYGHPRTGIPGIPESNPDPNYVAEEDFTAGTGKVIRNRVAPPETGRIPVESLKKLLAEQSTPSTAEKLSGSDTGLLSGFDLSAFVSENKWLLIGGAAVLAFFVMGRGK